MPHSPRCCSSHPRNPSGTRLGGPRKLGESPGHAFPANHPLEAFLQGAGARTCPGHSLLTESCISRLEKPATLVAVQK